MDFHLKQRQWREESEQQQEPPPPAKIPRLLLQQQQPHSSASSSVTLPFFVPPEPNPTRLPRMVGGQFSLAQWHELELQALIFRYMLAGTAVPPQLLQPIKKSLLSTSHFLSHYQPTLLESGYWGRSMMDPEPGRCRRTDGKKWRCSRDVVTGHKYCERHMHRGRNRSRKPVEIPTTTTTAAIGSGSFRTSGGVIAASPLASVAAGNHFSLSVVPPPSVDLLGLGQRPLELRSDNKGSLVDSQDEASRDCNPEGRILRRFFDDWPKSIEDTDSGRSNLSPRPSCTSLSISIADTPPSDFSLKLSTGNGGDVQGPQEENGIRDRPHLSWAGGWTGQQTASLGGPLAEALRSSTNSSPTSVLHQLPLRGAVSETSYVIS